MTIQANIVVFPGSNADDDAYDASAHVMGWNTKKIFHKETSLGNPDVVIVPGGFAHGDYLRCGAIARFSPIAEALIQFARAGGPVLGICNGFQILTELGLLPGALTRNVHLRFECRDVWIKPVGTGICTERGLMAQKAVYQMPIAHAEGRYHCDEETYKRLVSEDRIAFVYAGPDGKVGEENPNGSKHHIAGVYNAAKNVCGLMPHPERASDKALGSDDGLMLFHSIQHWLKSRQIV